MESGIYKIENIINGKLYVGSAKNFEKRKKEHFNALKNNKHKNKHLQNTWNKYGENNFKFVFIENVEPDLLIIREQYYMDLYKSYDRKLGYNIAPKAGNTLGVSPSEETRLKISKALTGKKRKVKYFLSEKTKKKMSESRMGFKPTKETCDKLKEKLIGNTNALGHIKTDIVRKNHSKLLLGKNRGEKNGMAITDKNEIINIRRDYDNGMSISKIMLKYNKKYSFTYQIVKRLRWNWLN